MGIIIRQSLKTSVINFLGVLIGFGSTLFIYPLHLEAYGFASNVYTLSSFIAAMATMGVATASVKYFHPLKRQDETYPKGMLTFLIGVVLTSYVILGCIAALFYKPMLFGLDQLKFNTTILTDNFAFTVFITVFLSLTTLFGAYASNMGRITIPAMLNNFAYKVFLPILIFLVYLGYITLHNIPLLITAFLAIICLLLIRYLFKLKILSFEKADFSRYWLEKKQLFKFIFVSNLTAIGSLLTFKIDTLMISGFLGYTSAGIYGLPLAMANVIDVPNQAINSISAPIIASHWKNKDMTALESIYKKSSLNLLMAGIIILLLGYFSFDAFGSISSNPEAFKNGKMIFLIIGLAKLIDLATSVNGALISYSDYYKYNLYFIGILAGINIYLNFILIPNHGLLGAASATFISIATFNLVKVLFLYLKFNLNPFSLDMIKILSFTVVLIALLYVIKTFDLHPFLLIFLNVVVVGLGFSTLVYKTNISPDGKGLLDKLLSKMKYKF